MAKKRKSERTALDEVEKTLYNSFCTAANSISHLYTQAQNQQRVAFHAGERHGVEKLYQWLFREHQNGSNITVAQIIQNLQSELEYGPGEEMTLPPAPHLQQVPVQQQPGVIGTVGTSGRTAALLTPIDQSKTSVFQGALSSPNSRCLPGFSMAPGGYGVDNLHTSVQLARRGSLNLEQLGDHNLREDQLDSDPYECVSATLGFQPPPPPPPHPHHHHQHHSQLVRNGTHTSHENDSSMDMHADGGADEYYR